MKIPPWLLLVALVTGCAQTPDHYDVLYGASATKQGFLKTLLILPAEFHIKERFPGNLYEDMPLWDDEASDNMATELAGELGINKGIRIIHDQAAVHSTAVQQHIPLLKKVARTINVHSRGSNLWSHKMKNFDYTIGSGLAELKTRNVDAALFVSGYQSVEPTRRDNSKTSIHAYSKQDLFMSDFHLTLILIDIESGRLLWTYFGRFADTDMRINSEVRAILARALSTFPENAFAS